MNINEQLLKAICTLSQNENCNTSADSKNIEKNAIEILSKINNDSVNDGTKNTVANSSYTPSVNKYNDTDNTLQLKINLINSVIPLLDSKDAETARFLIRLLTVISAIKQSKNGEN